MEGWVFCCVVFVSAASSCYGFCQFPPSLWCNSNEIMEQCNVSIQCDVSNCLARVNKQPLDFTVYYESKCERCTDLFANQLDYAYKAVAEIMNLQLVPYGNTKETPYGDSWKFTCEKGAKQCNGNIIQACAIHFAGNISVQFPFIQCMMTINEEPERAAKECSSKFGGNDFWLEIMRCSRGTQGLELEHQMALRTEAIKQPEDYYVPWVTLNGIHYDHRLDLKGIDFVRWICQHY